MTPFAPTKNPRTCSRGFDKNRLITHNPHGTHAPHEPYTGGVMEDILGKWGAWILTLLVLSGGTAYVLMASDDATIYLAFDSALITAGVATVILVFWAMYDRNKIALALSLSSLAAVLAALCLSLAGPIAFTVGLGFISFGCSFLAAAEVKPTVLARDGALLVYRALPVLGGLMYFSRWLWGKKMTEE